MVGILVGGCGVEALVDMGIVFSGNPASFCGASVASCS